MKPRISVDGDKTATDSMVERLDAIAKTIHEADVSGETWLRLRAMVKDAEGWTMPFNTRTLSSLTGVQASLVGYADKLLAAEAEPAKPVIDPAKTREVADQLYKMYREFSASKPSTSVREWKEAQWQAEKLYSDYVLDGAPGGLLKTETWPVFSNMISLQEAFLTLARLRLNGESPETAESKPETAAGDQKPEFAAVPEPEPAAMPGEDAWQASLLQDIPHGKLTAATLPPGAAFPHRGELWLVQRVDKHYVYVRNRLSWYTAFPLRDVQKLIDNGMRVVLPQKKEEAV